MRDPIQADPSRHASSVARQFYTHSVEMALATWVRGDLHMSAWAEGRRWTFILHCAERFGSRAGDFLDLPSLDEVDAARILANAGAFIVGDHDYSGGSCRVCGVSHDLNFGPVAVSDLDCWAVDLARELAAKEKTLKQGTARPQGTTQERRAGLRVLEGGRR